MCLKTILSCIFAILLNSETGLKFEGSDLSPFFGSGITFEHFQISENLPSLNMLKDLLNNLLSGIEISLTTALSILLLISSGPVALFGFNNPIRVSISLLVQTILDNLFSIQTPAEQRCHHSQ